MGNARSSNAGGHRRSHPLIPNRLQPHMGRSRNAFGPAAAPFPSQFPNPNAPPYYQYPGYYPPPPLPGTYGVPNGVQTNWVRGQWQNPAAAPLVDHQKAVTVRNDVNLKKDSLRVEADEENPGKFLVAFTFDAAVPGRITIMFFAKEGADHNLIATKKKQFKPVTVSFEQGLDQTFRQPSGTGIDFSMLEEMDAMKDGVQEVYPLVVKAEALGWNDSNSNVNAGANLQITQAVFVKDRNYYNVRVMKQVLWVNGNRYELQEIYGIGNAVNDDIDSNDSGKECVICLSEPRDTTVLPCRHMCMCRDCANILRFQTNQCPICRQPVEQLLEIKVGNDGDD